MNGQWIYFAVAFGVLLSLEDKKESLNEPVSFSKTFSVFLFEVVELCWYALALLLIHFFVIRFRPESIEIYQSLIKYPVFWLGSYAICRVAKKPVSFLVTVVAICFFAESQPQGVLGLLWFPEAVRLSVAIGLFHVVIQGILKRLVFSSVPATVQGLPALAGSAFILALVASGFAQILS